MRVLALVCVARVAYADDAGYATLDRQDRSTKLGAAVTYFSLPNQGQWTRLDLAGQYVSASGLGVYAQAPVLAYSSDSGGNTNFAVGGLVAKHG